MKAEVHLLIQSVLVGLQASSLLDLISGQDLNSRLMDLAKRLWIVCVDDDCFSMEKKEEKPPPFFGAPRCN